MSVQHRTPCPRCVGGTLVVFWDEAGCLNCGHVVVDPPRPWDFLENMAAAYVGPGEELPGRQRRRGAFSGRRREEHHGTATEYRIGCRCRPCTDANNVYIREYKQRRVAVPA